MTGLENTETVAINKPTKITKAKTSFSINPAVLANARRYVANPEVTINSVSELIEVALKEKLATFGITDVNV